MDAKTQKKQPYLRPEVATYSAAEILAQLGPALAAYGGPPFP